MDTKGWPTGVPNVPALRSGAGVLSGAASGAHFMASDEVTHSHAISRAGWTARERRQGHPDRGKYGNVAVANSLRQRAARGAAHERPSGIEVFGGILRLSRAAERVALDTIGVIERDPYDLDYAKRRFRCYVSADVLTREYEMWRFSSDILFVLACAPCRIVANPGKQLGLDDPEAYVTVASAADVANHFNAPFVVQENHANIVLLRNGEVLTAIDSAQRAGGRARTPIVDGAPLGAEFVHDSGMPELRHRVALHHEDVRLVNMIAPPCSRSERSEASVAARGGGYQVKRARVISGDNTGAKLLPFQSRCHNV